MPNDPRDPERGEPAPAPTPSLSREQRRQLAELAAALKEGRSVGRPKQRPTTDELRARAHAYWDSQSPEARRIHTLAGRIAIGERARAELEDLLRLLEAQQQQDDAAEGGPSA
jgi:hypothetical protein